MSHQRKMKRKIIITIIAVLVVIAGIIGFFAVKDLKQEKNLCEEIASIQELTANIGHVDMDQVNEKLQRTVTTGDYAVVEQAVKNYMADNFNAMITISNVLDDTELTTALTAENYEADGPDFVKTKQILTDLQNQLTDAKETMKTLASTDGMMSYLKNMEDSYYIDLYKEIIGAEEVSAEDINDMEASVDDVWNLIQSELSVLDFLAENKGNWEVQDGTITFNSDELMNQYNQLLLAVQ